MGSSPSTPDSTDDPWWPIENQNFSLDQSPLLNVVAMDRQGQSASSIDEIDENCEISDVCSGENLNNESQSENSETISDASDDTNKVESVDRKEQTLEEFKEELRIKREKRQNAIADLRNEITNLRQQLNEEKEMNRQLRRENLCSSSTNSELVGQEEIIEDIATAIDVYDKPHQSQIELKSELANVQLSLQLANSEILSLQAELNVRQKQTDTLKEVNAVSKQMIRIKEDQLSQLREKLKTIEESLADREMKLMSESLRQEYDRQLANIRNLRSLYEERARVSAAERENLNRQLDTKKAELEAEVEKSTNLTERVNTLEADLRKAVGELNSTKDELSEYKSENRELHEEMKVINELFSQLLMGFNGGNDINIDKLSNMLEDNRDLLNDITKRETCKDGAAALPKLLFDLVTQAEESCLSKDEASGSNVEQNVDEVASGKSNVSSAQEICHNLPKVWKVLIELLNHQKAEQVSFTENGESEDCYNSVQTPTGPKLVLSVSKTYIKLKDLILEKKFLQKETNKLKNLNNHLENRLSHQEKRLGAVSIELNKTWNLVGKMQRQHRQLHTHEQVLRYQLQQKRRMLNELKDELEYCRRKWALAREKNNESQNQWNDLRSEFSRRKQQDANNSGESGYSDEPLSDDDDNSDNDELGKPKIEKIAESDVMSSPKNMPRLNSTSPELSTKRDKSATPIATLNTQVFQTTSEIVQPNLTFEASIVTKPVESSDLNYAASASVVVPQTVTKVTVKNVASEGPSTSNGGARPKCVDEVRPKLSRELRNKATKVKEKRQGEETLEEMFFRLSGQQPPQPEDSSVDDEENDDDDDEELDNEIQSDDATILKVDVLQLNPPPVETDDSLNPEDISHVILSEEDEERRAQRAARFKRLEEQCQQLITQVINNSNRGDELNSQLDSVQRRFPPSRESSQSVDKSDEDGAAGCSTETVPKDDTACLSQKEQEYTSRRAERLKRLEEECKEFLNKQNKSKLRANEMSNKLDKLHRRYGSQESAEGSASETKEVVLTEAEEAYTARRAERLKRLEEQSAELLDRMAQSSSRVKNIESSLDDLHSKFGGEKVPNETDVVGECNVNEAMTIDVVDGASGGTEVPSSPHSHENSENSTEELDQNATEENNTQANSETSTEELDQNITEENNNGGDISPTSTESATD